MQTQLLDRIERLAVRQFLIHFVSEFVLDNTLVITILKPETKCIAKLDKSTFQYTLLFFRYGNMTK